MATEVPQLPPAALPLPNAFASPFLSRMAERDEPSTAAEADTAGPWRVEPAPGGFAVLREGEELELGDRPTAVFRDRAAALLAAAVLPTVGREAAYRLGQDADPKGYALRFHGEVAGHLQFFDEALAGALHVADGLARSPRSLATLLEAAGGLALERAGRILDRQTEGRPS
jgi:hypothetical protein